MDRLERMRQLKEDQDDLIKQIEALNTKKASESLTEEELKEISKEINHLKFKCELLATEARSLLGKD